MPVNIISSHLCLHEIANPLLMEAAFANIIGADMNAVGYKFEFNDLQEALKHILQGETRDILNQELFELKGSYSDVGLSFKALSKLSQIDRLMRIYNSIPNQEFNGTNNSFEKLQDLYQVFNQTYLGMIHYSPEPF